MPSPWLIAAAGSAGALADIAGGAVRGATSVVGSFAQTLASVLTPPTADAGEIDDSLEFPATLEISQEVADRAAAEISERVKKHLAEMGIDTSHALRLSADGRGGLTLLDDHPDRAAIEEKLSSDPDLVHAVNKLSAHAALAEAGKRHLEFREEYERDPQGAGLRLLEELGSRTQTSLTITLHDDRVEYDLSSLFAE